MHSRSRGASLTAIPQPPDIQTSNNLEKEMHSTQGLQPQMTTRQMLVLLSLQESKTCNKEWLQSTRTTCCMITPSCLHARPNRHTSEDESFEAALGHPRW